jgi:hypothetical protein
MLGSLGDRGQPPLVSSSTPRGRCELPHQEHLPGGRLPVNHRIENVAGRFSSPASLDFGGCEPNQQFRVDLLDPASPVRLEPVGS